jgi:hypothetical protein
MACRHWTVIMDSSTQLQLLDGVRRALERPFRLAHQAGAVAMDLFCLRSLHGLTDDPQVDALVAKFGERLREAELDDLLHHQMRYAVRLASATGPLSYEEMHKLFSLCDQIHAIRSLGLPLESPPIGDFDAAVHDRFAAQRRTAVLVAEDRAEWWNRELWWYAEKLARSDS